MSAPPRAHLLVVRTGLGMGGADRVTLTLLAALPRDRFEISLALMRAEGELLGELPSDVPVDALGARSLWTAWLPLIRVLRRRRPGIVLSTSSGTNIIAVLAGLLAGGGARLVLSERGLLFRGRRSPRKLALFAAKRLLYRRADEITAVSAGVKADLVHHLKLDPARVRVVYNPIVTPELERLAAAPAGHPWLDQPTPVVLAAGRLVAEKDFALLVRSFARLRARRPVRLVILGEGPQRGELERLIAELELGDDVQLPGFDPNPFRFMSRCAVFVLSSRFEGLPGALIQAMACGAPVVACDCPTGPAEIVTDGEDGLLVPVGDEAALAAAVGRLLDEPALRHRLARAGRRSSGRFAVAPALGDYVAALTGGPPPDEGSRGA